MNLKNRIQFFSNKEKNLTVNQDIPVEIDKAKVKAKVIAAPITPLVFELLTAKEAEYQKIIHQKLMGVLDLSAIAKMENAVAKKQISEIARRIIDEESIPVIARTRQLIVNEILNDILGFGPLEHLLTDPSIADIMVNGCKSIFIERFGKVEKTYLL